MQWCLAKCGPSCELLMSSLMKLKLVHMPLALSLPICQFLICFLDTQWPIINTEMCLLANFFMHPKTNALQPCSQLQKPPDHPKHRQTLFLLRNSEVFANHYGTLSNMVSLSRYANNVHIQNPNPWDTLVDKIDENHERRFITFPLPLRAFTFR